MIAWLAETLVASTLLLLLVLAVRRPIAQAFGARVAYALWLLPAIRMVLPPLPGHRALYVPVMLLDPARPIAVGLVPPVAAAERLALPPALMAQVPDPQWSWSALLVAAWALGAILWFGWQLVRYRWFLARALRDATLLGTECGVEVLLSDGVAGPVAAGIVHRRILLPRDFVHRYDAAERRQALLHEGAHHDRRDLLANLAALAVVALHWWNPLAHLAHRAFRADQELACDATVLARADAADRYAYGRALVKSSGGGTPAAACALDNATAIKRRLRAIGRGAVAGPLRALGALLATAAIGGGLIATASGGTLPSSTELATPPDRHDPEVRREAARARIEAVQARREAHVSAAEARRVGERARRAGERARVAGERARLEGERAAAATEFAQAYRQRPRADGAAAIDHDRVARASIEATRRQMADACAARGQPIAADERDWGELALCGKARFRAELRRTIAAARGPVAPVLPAPPAPPRYDHGAW